MMTADLFYALDRSFLPCTLVSAFSAAEHAARPLRLALLCDGDMGDQADLIDNLGRHPNIAGLECLELEFDVDADGKANRLPRPAYGRLMSPRYFKGRSIYLDGDTVVLSDLGELLRHDLCDQPIGAVQDTGFLYSHAIARSKHYLFREHAKRHIRNQEETVPNFRADRYFNSGVLLLDFNAIIGAGFAEAMGDVGTASTYLWQDQDHLNSVFAGRACWLPPTWNAQWSNIRTRRRCFDAETRAAFAESRRAPKIIHYAGRGGKPWDNFKRARFKRLLSYAVPDMLLMWAQYAQWRRRAADFLGRDPFEKADRSRMITDGSSR